MFRVDVPGGGVGQGRAGTRIPRLQARRKMGTPGQFDVHERPLCQLTPEAEEVGRHSRISRQASGGSAGCHPDANRKPTIQRDIQYGGGSILPRRVMAVLARGVAVRLLLPVTPNSTILKANQRQDTPPRTRIRKNVSNVDALCRGSSWARGALQHHITSLYFIRESETLEDVDKQGKREGRRQCEPAVHHRGFTTDDGPLQRASHVFFIGPAGRPLGDGHGSETASRQQAGRYHLQLHHHLVDRLYLRRFALLHDHVRQAF